MDQNANTVKKTPKVKQNDKKQAKTMAAPEHKAESQKAPGILSPIKSRLQPAKKGVNVGVFLMKSSGNLEFFITPAFSLLQIDNCAYEWNPESDYILFYDTGKQMLSCNFFYEGNVKAQRIRSGLSPEAYAIEGKMIDGKDLMNKMELAVLGLGMAEKASKERVVTEDNIKWLWVMIAVVVVAVIMIYVMGGI